MYAAEFDGVLFVEGALDGVRALGHVDVKIYGAFSQAQLKSLDDVKRELVTKVRALRGNALINFKYGQRSTFWTTLVGIDDVGWYGAGDVASLSADQVAALRAR